MIFQVCKGAGLFVVCKKANIWGVKVRNKNAQNSALAKKVIVKSGDLGIGQINNSSASKSVNTEIDSSKYYLIPTLDFAQTTNIAYGNVNLSYTLSGSTLNVFVVAKGETVNPTVHWNVIGIPK